MRISARTIVSALAVLALMALVAIFAHVAARPDATASPETAGSSLSSALTSPLATPAAQAQPPCNPPWPTPPAVACPWLPTPVPSPTPWYRPTAWIPPTPPAQPPTALPTGPIADNPSGLLLFSTGVLSGVRPSPNYQPGAHTLAIDRSGIVASPMERWPIGGVTPTRVGQMAPSPDGRSMLGISASEGGDVVVALDPQSGQSRFIVSGGVFIAWHPNSLAFYYSRIFSGSPGLWKFEVASGNGVMVAQPATLDITGIAVSPDGRTLVYGTNSFDTHQIWRANSDGSAPTLLLDSPAIVAVWGWSPAGNAILFTGEPTPQQKGANKPVPNLWIMDCEGGTKKPLKGSFKFGYGFQPVWSPVGDKVAYVGISSSNPCWNKDDTYRADPYCRYRGVAVYVEDVNRGTLKLVRDNAIDPAWSPDGSLLTFAALDSHQQVDLWISKPDGSEAHRLTDTPELELHPTWLGRTP